MNKEKNKPINLFKLNLNDLKSNEISIEGFRDKELENDNNLPTTVLSACSVCPNQPEFSSQEELRYHFKLDFHNLNLKRKLQNKSLLSEEEFENFNFDEESLEGSDEDSEADTEEVVKNSTPFYSFKTDLFDGNKKLLIYKHLFFDDENDKLERLRFLQGGNQTVCLLMVGAGHFAGAIFKCNIDAKPILQKTFHRYTTRRKQGGAQSANDNKGGLAKSAGAQIRRYNEMALQQEIKDLLISWKAELKACDLIFTRVASTQRKLFFFDESILDYHSQKVRNLPFITKRPTFTELQRCFWELFSVKVVDVEIETVTEKVKKLNLNEKNKLKPLVNTLVEAAVEEVDPIAPIDDALEKLMEFLHKGKFPQFKTLFESCEKEKILRRLRNKDGVSLLHKAAKASQPLFVTYLLEQGADPTLRATIGGNTRPYDECSDKITRDAFKDFNLKNPDAWDYDLAGIPKAQTEEELQSQQEKKLEKKRKQREKDKLRLKEKKLEKKEKKELLKLEEEQNKEAIFKPANIIKLSNTEQSNVGLSPEARMRLDREKRYCEI
ncbi:hypothetical protein HDU92_000478 [Lobulomyces angularis]|nr:hypothetical protein HDU92_000478 [Lobulomyces angularis]